MRFDPNHESNDVIDRRGQSSGGGGGGLGLALGLLPLLGRSKIGMLVLLVIVGLSVAGGLFGLGRDNPADNPSADTRAAKTETTGANDPKHFVAFVLDDTQKTWRGIFQEKNRPYENAKLVLFTDRTATGCGAGRAASGPFYCPNDERVYIDLSFYNELSQRFGAAGDFAQAYVIAHEIGHHVQHLLHVDTQVGPRSRGEESASVRLELQADCFAGIWAKSSEQRKLLEPGDFDEALRAASAIGDDRIQRSSGGAIHPESFTHGTAAQRARWLRTGYQRGTIESCDTFGATSL